MHWHSVVEKELVSKVSLITVQIEKLSFASMIFIQRVNPYFSGDVINLEEYINSNSLLLHNIFSLLARNVEIQQLRGILQTIFLLYKWQNITTVQLK